jgi:hypothetical protein
VTEAENTMRDILITRLQREQTDTLLQLSEETRRNRYISFVLLALTAVIAVVLGVGFYNTNSISKVQDKQVELQNTQRESLCTLFALFIAAEPRVPPDQTPEQLAERASAFAVIHNIYSELGCK